jgi:hypothetical protein
MVPVVVVIVLPLYVFQLLLQGTTAFPPSIRQVSHGRNNPGSRNVISRIIRPPIVRVGKSDQ